MARKKPNLKLFVVNNKENTLQNQEQDQNRPLTATLEKPQILNIQFLGRIDMSLMRKEFLTISNLCRLPLTTVNKEKSKSAFKTLRKKAFKKVDETDDEISSRNAKLSYRQRQYVKLSDINSCKTGVQGQMKQINPPSIDRQRSTLVAHNTNDVRIKNNSIITRTDAPVNKTSPAIFKSTKHDQFSCSSCGRSDKPERFHTHPSNKKVPLPKRNSSPTKLSGGTVVSPIKKVLKSELIGKGRTKENLTKMNSKMTQNNGNINSDLKNKGPRTLICYLCGRQYGTASLKLHEPKCIEKWHRENSKLPRHLRRALPQKPDHAQTPDEWNNNAWKTMQNSLVPCPNCNRTFLPDRLQVHQRSCKSSVNGLDKNNLSENKRTVPDRKSTSPPRWVQCSTCGNNFSKRSLKIHEESCAKKAEILNNNYLSNNPSPMKEYVSNKNSQQSETRSNSNSGKRPRILPCYICGRPFSVSSIHIHEPQCLKKWKIQNDKLPKDKRRPEPKKPDFVFTPIGELNYEKTFDRMWDNHLSELIPCNRCGRTFFPDRIEKHEGACAGNGIKFKSVI